MPSLMQAVASDRATPHSSRASILAKEQNLRRLSKQLAFLLFEFETLVRPSSTPETIEDEFQMRLARQSLAERAIWLYKQRRVRAKHFEAELFGEPAWDLLLDLFVSECQGRDIQVSSACIASAVPATTALRWITILEQGGLLERFDDPRDRRRSMVRLTDAGRSAMINYLTGILEK